MEARESRGRPGLFFLGLVMLTACAAPANSDLVPRHDGWGLGYTAPPKLSAWNLPKWTLLSDPLEAEDAETFRSTLEEMLPKSSTREAWSVRVTPPFLIGIGRGSPNKRDSVGLYRFTIPTSDWRLWSKDAALAPASEPKERASILGWFRRQARLKNFRQALPIRPIKELWRYEKQVHDATYSDTKWFYFYTAGEVCKGSLRVYCMSYDW